MRKISGLFGVLILSVGLMSCGGGGDSSVSPPPPPPPPPPPTCATGTFCMGSSTFVTSTATAQPVALTVAANAAVTWTNDSGIQHDVIFDDPSSALAVGGGGSGNIPLHTSGSHQRQFTATGHHPFHCSIHGTATSGMRGDVLVQ
jgi:plastocyanin